jgi:hypothetical protein
MAHPTAETLMRSRQVERQGDPLWQDVHSTYSFTLIPSLPSLSAVEIVLPPCPRCLCGEFCLLLPLPFLRRDIADIGRIRRSRIDAMIAATTILAGARLATLDKRDSKVFVPHGLKLV